MCPYFRTYASYPILPPKIYQRVPYKVQSSSLSMVRPLTVRELFDLFQSNAPKNDRRGNRCKFPWRFSSLGSVFCRLRYEWNDLLVRFPSSEVLIVYETRLHLPGQRCIHRRNRKRRWRGSRNCFHSTHPWPREQINAPDRQCSKTYCPRCSRVVVCMHSAR